MHVNKLQRSNRMKRNFAELCGVSDGESAGRKWVSAACTGEGHIRINATRKVKRKRARCLATKKERTQCGCGDTKCGSNICTVTGKARQTCRCGAAKCGRRFCLSTGKQRAECRCTSIGCGSGICPTTRTLRPVCACVDPKCGARLLRDALRLFHKHARVV